MVRFLNTFHFRVLLFEVLVFIFQSFIVDLFVFVYGISVH